MIDSVNDRKMMLEAPEAQAEEAALRQWEIMERIGCKLLLPIPVRAEGRVMATLAG